MGNKRRSVRFDEHTWMLLKEVSEKMGVNMSVVIRSMVARSLREITDAVSYTHLTLPTNSRV